MTAMRYFFWSEHRFDPIEDFKMNVHLFMKIDSPCIANWTLHKTAKDNKDQISFHSSTSILENSQQHEMIKVHAYECMSSSKLSQLEDLS